MFLVRCPILQPLPSLAFGPHLTRGLIICALLSTRQGAAAFNQPLSFDTSSVTNMDRMFDVRFPRPPRPPPSGRRSLLSRALPEHIWPYLDHTPRAHMSCTACAPHTSRPAKPCVSEMSNHMFLVHCPTSHPPPSLASGPHLTRGLILCPSFHLGRERRRSISR